jgi:hypothetical protein
MTLSITGTTGTFAPSSATIKTPGGMASPNYTGNSFAYYHFTDAGGRVCSLRQSGPVDGPGTNTLEFVAGGQQGNSLLRLTQQNAIDLVQAIVNFANTGTLT